MSKAPTHAELIEQSRDHQRVLADTERKLAAAVARAQRVPVSRIKPLTLPRNALDQYHRQFGMAAPAPEKPADAVSPRGASRQRRRAMSRGSRPNVGLEAMYRQKLETKLGEMNASVIYWLRSAYRNNPPEMARDGNAFLVALDGRLYDGDGNRIVDRGSGLAHDRSPASILKSAFDKLAKRWLRQFDELADDLGKWFGQASASRSDAALLHTLRRSGLAVKFTMTPEMRDVMHATVNENVSLIRSIPQQYLTQVEGSVMRSVTAGRDLASLTTELREHYGVTKKRAKLIAMQQNNAATAAFTRVRQVQYGLKAVWMHSSAGKTYRPTHVANNGKTYDPTVGWLDPAEKKYIFPGQLINCRCYSKTVIPGFDS